MKSIKDLIYFDIEKAKSLVSQLNDGLIKEISREIEEESIKNSGVGVDVKFLKADTGGSTKDKKIRIERLDVFHEMLNTIEHELSNKSLLTNLNEKFSLWDTSFNEFMDEIPNLSFLKVNGWVSFEDYDQLKNVLSNFNDIQRLIYSSNLIEREEYIKMKADLENVIKQGNKGKISAMEKKIDAYLVENTDISIFDRDWIKKLKLFLDTFSPERLNFRLLPFDDFPQFQLLANLKSQYMLEGGFNNTVFTYGSRPNIKLTVLGILTSCPREEDPRINPSDEYLMSNNEDLSNEAHYDKVFRNVFNSFEAFEKFFFVPRYPKIAISPIAIYREIPFSE